MICMYLTRIIWQEKI